MSGTNVKEFYAHDLVYKFDERKRIVFGVVSESYESSDSDETCALQKGQILVTWSNPTRKRICRQSKVYLLCRCIAPGDIVRRLEDGKETQRGYCKKTKQFATVQIVESDKVIEHVPDSRLCFVKPFQVGDAVCLGDKFGRIQSIDEMIRMQSKCGSIVEVRRSINYNIRDYWFHSINGAYHEAEYPGQTVFCTPMHLRDPKWIKKSKSMMRKMEIGQKFTIQSIEICLIEVWWYSPNGHTEYAELKDDEIKRLKVLPYSENLVMGDRYFLKLKPTDILLKKRDWIKKKSLQSLPHKVPKSDNSTLTNTCAEPFDADDDWCTEEDEESDNKGEISIYGLHKIKQRKKTYPNLNKFSSGSIVAVQVFCADARVTVVWQDGTEEKDIPTTELYYSVSQDDHEFFPGEWVVSNSNENSDKYGVVQRVNFQERTAEIKWFSSVDANQEPQELATNESSVYDLKKHVKFVFRPGSVVKAKPTVEDKMGKVIDSCPQGYVIVQWLGGKRENCWPQNIELILESEDFEFPDAFDSDDDLSEDAYSWETESVESFDGDVTDEINLQNMAARVDFIRNRISYLREAFKHYNITQNFHFVKDLLCIYDNSGYLDKYLGTSFFSTESKHFQALLLETKKKAKSLGIELRGRMFSRENLSCPTKMKNAEKDNIQKMIKLESKVNVQIEMCKECSGESCPTTPDSSEPAEKPQENLCVELLVMLKMRMDLIYAEIISRIGGRQALTVLTNSSENPLKPSPSTTTALQNALLTPETPPKVAKPIELIPKNEAFSILEEAPDTHRYFSSKFVPKDLQKFLVALQKEYKLLKDSLPAGVWVRTYDNRMDLLSVMIRGPAKTPYEDGLFLFDIQLSPDYPKNPPGVHYISYITEPLNPNLYVEGKVCVSLLGTWMGRGSEMWGPNSTLLQLIVSIQGLILVAQPYFNEAGYERQTHTQQGCENSRTYNEFVILKLVQSMTELLNAAPKVFQNEVLAHFQAKGEAMCERLMKYCDEEPLVPEFPLLPVSKGFKLSLGSALNGFRQALKKALEGRNKEALL
ncbi:uncharacterized protein LOC659924 [Tribolium castaneum]|uniref:UBC core domain-containing protein n=1 Tax=Tribolium castaneum TaxID=7070 RepID=D2A559_TRICA|nr:PREDICTED: uncharacterized protein LOC659924 [Tribolium castaneum]EFA05319.1 hypothetical protein TcasGA2_TC015477 [Tribolium castaneum]|eukprot:XP_971283.1 PREDICTED: uncharacterized protein LOC659924 [Tribolium castaneum]